MNYVMSLIGLLFFTFKLAILLVIVLSPLIAIYTVWYLFIKKYKTELDILRKTRNGGYEYKWQRTELKWDFSRDYELGLNDYLKEFHPKVMYLRKFFILSFTLIISCYLAYMIQPTVNYTSYERQLFAFQDNQGFYIKGRTLGSGSGSDEIVYYYTLSNSDGSFKSYRATANMSTMNYTKDTPHVKYTMKHIYALDNKWYTGIVRFLIPKDTNDSGDLTRIDFYIPEGSVESNYNSDLQ